MDNNNNKIKSVPQELQGSMGGVGNGKDRNAENIVLTEGSFWFALRDSPCYNICWQIELQ